MLINDKMLLHFNYHKNILRRKALNKQKQLTIGICVTFPLKKTSVHRRNITIIPSSQSASKENTIKKTNHSFLQKAVISFLLHYQV